MQQLIAHACNDPTSSLPSFLAWVTSIPSSFRKFKNDNLNCKLIGVFDIFFHKLFGLFLVPVPGPACAGAHARHVLAFVVSRFSATNYLDTEQFITVVDVLFQNGNDLFLQCCPGTINHFPTSCRLKTSTPLMTKRAERSRQRAQEQAQERHKPNFAKMSKNFWNWSICGTNVIFFKEASAHHDCIWRNSLIS